MNGLSLCQIHFAAAAAAAAAANRVMECLVEIDVHVM